MAAGRNGRQGRRERASGGDTAEGCACAPAGHRRVAGQGAHDRGLPRQGLRGRVQHRPHPRHARQGRRDPGQVPQGAVGPAGRERGRTTSSRSTSSTPTRSSRSPSSRPLLKDADELLLATDEDREGEAIAWHLLEELKPKVPARRMVFHEITPEAIAAGRGQPAGDGRRAWSRPTRPAGCWTGSTATRSRPVLWKKVMPQLSAGRVQSVAIRLVVDRERERIAFRRRQVLGPGGRCSPSRSRPSDRR